MYIQPLSQNNINFGYYTHIKDCWLAGKLPEVKKGLYGFPLTKKNVSNEHLVPYCECHSSKQGNIALADKRINNARGNLPLKEVLTKGQLLDYLAQFVGIRVKHKNRVFDGDKYIEDVLENTSKLDLKA